MPEKRCGKPKKYGRSAGILPAVAGASRSRPFCHPERSEGSLSFHLNFGAPHLLQLADVGTTTIRASASGLSSPARNTDSSSPQYSIPR